MDLDGVQRRNLGSVLNSLMLERERERDHGDTIVQTVCDVSREVNQAVKNPDMKEVSRDGD